jgi:inorganic pyrophosphatase/exopolyphosphatase
VEFEVGTIIIDAVDMKDPVDTEDDRLVFRGAASGVMYDDAEDATDRIEDAVHRIFTQWPL